MVIELSDFDRPASTPADPFADSVGDEAFYLDEFRKLSINKLVHLAPYCELLLVHGVPGAGKSSFLQRFIKRASESWRTALLQGEAALSEAVFLHQLIVTLEIPHAAAAEQSSQARLYEVVVKYLYALGQSGRRAIVVIDDGQVLNESVLTLLGQLLNDERVNGALSVIICATPDFSQTLGRYTVLKQKLAYSLAFEPFDREALRGYIEHRLRVAGIAGEIGQFNDVTLDWLYAQSRGLPAKVNALAREVLDGKNAEVGRQRERPILQWVLVSVIVGAAAVALYMQDQINALFGGGQAPPVASGTSEAPVAEAPVADTALPAGVEEAGVEDAAPEPVLLPVEPPPVPEPPAPVAEAPSPAANEAVSAGEALPPRSAPVVEEVAQSLAGAIRQPAIATLPGHDWLLAQNSAHYTLQLMALLDERKVTDFFNRYRLEGKAGLYHLERSSGRLTAVVYGAFASYAEAEAAAEVLPRSWGVGKPWIRRFSAVRADMER